MALAKHLSTPFFVSQAPREAEEINKEEYFQSLEEAYKIFNILKENNAIFVYLGELGVFADMSGHLKIDYFAFETNDHRWWEEYAEISQIGSRGFGRGWKFDELVTTYKPLAECNWSL